MPADDTRHRLAWLIAAQAVMTLLAGVNLLAVQTTTSIAAGEFVRWRELLLLPVNITLEGAYLLALGALVLARR